MVPEELADLPYADLLQSHTGPLAVEGDYDTVHFDGLAFPGGQAANGSRFLESAVTDCVFDDTDLRRSRFNDLWASGTRFTGVSLAETDWLDSSLTGCSLAGVEAFGAVLRRVVLRRCKLDSVNLRGAALHDVVFEDCVLRDVDFGEATLSGVTFPGSRLEQARFGRATATKVDLRGAVAIDLADGYDSLRGAVISSTQLLDLAPALAATLGIDVEDR
ncbi:pentapeptide repeat-containing protein [Actinacidiphila rubida]|uniref:Pentapeptide repeat-containing protein n=1 Tax=Actinacidiphila rubida TaxID=310780 RepID=A0A1H8U466_9ACTN|nr:pentapeptide repeat-containing protein [Actinacidiphila rubida]SEO97644.1 Pentapeptide repeat-containing protein [Actinacidiphila rubida]